MQSFLKYLVLIQLIKWTRLMVVQTGYRSAISTAIVLAVVVLLVGLVARPSNADETAPASTSLTFKQHARPVFRNHCASCHNGNRTEGDLNLINYTALMQGGSSGDVIEPGAADDSYLFQLITHAESPEMPPSGQKIPAADIEIIRRWIDQGAINKAGAKPTRKRRRPSVEMTSSVGERPDQAAMPGNISKNTFADTTRDPIAVSLASSPWAPVVAVAAANQIVLYHGDVASSDPLLGVLSWENGMPQSLRFSRDGSRLIAGGGRAAAAGSFAVWNVATGERELNLGDELDAVLAIDLSPSGQQVATGGPERVVRLYSLEDRDSNEPTVVLKEHTDWVTAIEFSPDGKYLVTGDRSGGLILRIAETGESLFRLPSHKAAVTAVSWRADGKVFASASESGKVSFWNVAVASTGKSLKTFEAHRGGCLAISFTRKGDLVSGGRDKQVVLWNLKGKPIRKFKGSDEIITSVCFNDESGYVFAGNFSGKLKTWRLSDGKASGDLKTNPTPD